MGSSGAVTRLVTLALVLPRANLDFGHSFFKLYLHASEASTVGGSRSSEKQPPVRIEIWGAWWLLILPLPGQSTRVLRY